MVSKSAQADIEEMWEKGLKPTVSDIILLNALGLIVENASKPTESMYYLRRCAWLDDVVLKQPVLAHEVWLQKSLRRVSEDWLSQLTVRAFVCCTEPEDLPSPDQPEDIRNAVEKFIPTLARFTQAQIAAAVMYVTCGTDWRYGEDAPPNKNVSDDVYMHFGPEFCSAIGVIHNGIAVGVGLTIGEALDLPRSTFEAMVERRLRYDGSYDMKKVQSAAEDDYLRAFDEISNRLKRTDNG